jgi:hypothetical protein
MAVPGPHPAWRPRPSRLARLLSVLLVADAALAWAAVLGVWTLLDRVWRGLAGRPAPLDEVEQHWGQLVAVRRLQDVAWLATAVVFVVWLGRARDGRHDLAGPRAAGTPPWMVAWWLLVVLATLLDPPLLRLGEDLRARLAVGGLTVALVLGQLATIAAAALGIVVVRRLEAARLARLPAGGRA